jgi:hypothetical protein
MTGLPVAVEADAGTGNQAVHRKQESGGFVMTLKRVLLLALVALLGIPCSNANAYWRGGIWVGPGYYRPYPVRIYVGAPVVVAPAPVIVTTVPPPVYVVQPAPQPVYVQQAPAQPASVTTQPAPTSYQNLPAQPVPVR